MSPQSPTVDRLRRLSNAAFAQSAARAWAATPLRSRVSDLACWSIPFALHLLWLQQGMPLPDCLSALIRAIPGLSPIVFTAVYCMLIIWTNEVRRKRQEQGLQARIERAKRRRSIRDFPAEERLDAGNPGAFLIFNCYMALAHAAIAVCAAGTALGAPHLTVELRLLGLAYYSLRILELFGSVAVLAMSPFDGITQLHMWLRLCGLWSAYAAYGSSYNPLLPLLVNSGAHAAVHSHYSVVMLRGASGWWSTPTTPKPPSGADDDALPGAEVRKGQFGVCLAHAAYSIARGDGPLWAVLLCLVTAFTGLVFYTDFYEEVKQPPAEGSEQRGPAASPRSGRMPRLWFCMDCCGFLGLYHAGVMFWVQTHLLQNRSPEQVRVGFSGSSGGALLAYIAALSPRSCMKEVMEEMISACRWVATAPWRWPELVLLVVVKAARFHRCTTDPNAWTRANGRVQVLLTKLVPRWPFTQGQVVSEYSSFRDLLAVLFATTRVPLLLGIRPVKIPGRGLCYDGMMWPSCFVPWKSVSSDDPVITSSATDRGADISSSVTFPPWWSMLPPGPDVARGIFWQAYCDTDRWMRANASSLRNGDARIPRQFPLPDDGANMREAEYYIPVLHRAVMATWVRALTFALAVCMLVIAATDWGTIRVIAIAGLPVCLVAIDRLTRHLGRSNGRVELPSGEAQNLRPYYPPADGVTDTPEEVRAFANSFLTEYLPELQWVKDPTGRYPGITDHLRPSQPRSPQKAAPEVGITRVDSPAMSRSSPAADSDGDTEETVRDHLMETIPQADPRVPGTDGPEDPRDPDAAMG
eukprot:TRINITY_DN8376_c1_g1_i1.p1 TRINITY_DN8376_c1_g1~~TRINITY_DN8376_c1_g1_i1.p1  ORF type:complete len:891 (+),score=266.86 TRINITY_DN8376_c1_g1_i1:252-2675(+)